MAQPSGMTELQQKKQQKQNRQRRLSVALRENLKRRKAQARGRTDGASRVGERGAGSHDSAEFSKDNRSE
ncbi:MAG: hypothetical protein ACRECO_19615 [Xanthobacteraceae bacterium]